MAPNPRRCAPAGTEWAIQKRRTDKEAKRKDCGPALYADQQSETSQSDQERLAVLTGLCTISKLVCYTSLSIFIIYHAKGKESNYWSCSQKPSKNGQKNNRPLPVSLVRGGCPEPGQHAPSCGQIWAAAGFACEQLYYTTFQYFGQIFKMHLVLYQEFPM